MPCTVPTDEMPRWLRPIVIIAGLVLIVAGCRLVLGGEWLGGLVVVLAGCSLAGQPNRAYALLARFLPKPPGGRPGPQP